MSASSQIKATWVKFARACPRFTSLVRDWPLRLRARAAATMWPLLLSWKRLMPVSSKFIRTLQRPGRALASWKLLQVHSAIA